MEIGSIEKGKIGLIQELDDGTICQIGLTQEQSDMLQIIVSSIAMGKPLIRLPKQYNLKLANN